MNGLIIGIGIMLCIMSGLIIHDYQGVLKWEEVKDDKPNFSKWQQVGQINLNTFTGYTFVKPTNNALSADFSTHVFFSDEYISDGTIACMVDTSKNIAKCALVNEVIR